MVQTRTLFIVHFLLSIWTSTQGPADGQHAYAAGVALHFFSNCLVRPCMHTRMIIGRSIDPYYFAWLNSELRIDVYDYHTEANSILCSCVLGMQIKGSRGLLRKIYCRHIYVQVWFERFWSCTVQSCTYAFMHVAAKV